MDITKTCSHYLKLGHNLPGYYVQYEQKKNAFWAAGATWRLAPLVGTLLIPQIDTPSMWADKN